MAKWAVAAVLLAAALGASYAMGSFGTTAPPANTPSGDRSAEAQALYVAGLQKLPRPGQVDAAIADFEKALALHPSLDDAKARLAAALGMKATKAMEMDDPDAALLYAARGLEWRPRDPELEGRRAEATGALAARLAKALAIVEPKANAVVATREFVVAGKVSSCQSLHVVLARVDDPTVAFSRTEASVADGGFSARVTVPDDGRFVVQLSAVDRHGVGASSAAVEVVVDTVDPVVTILWPAADVKVGSATVVRGRVVDATACQVTIDGEPVEVVGGEWSRAMTLREGHPIVVEAIDAGGRRTSVRPAIAVDATPPELAFEAVPAMTNQASVPLRGTVKGLDGGRLTLGSMHLEPTADGRIDTELSLPKDAVYATVVVAIDEVGNRAEYPIRVRRHTVAPLLEWIEPSVRKLLSPGEVEVMGRVDSGLGPPNVTVNGVAAILDGDRWRARVTVTSEDQTVVVVEATDAAGNQRALERTLQSKLVFSERIAADFEALGARTGHEDLPNRIVHAATKIAFVLVPPGRYWVGSPAGESGRSGDETRHRVTISQPFYIAETEVTQKQWRTVMGTEPWRARVHASDNDDLPATYVSWDDAVAFCDRLTDRARTAGRLPAGHQYCLPTEAQWEIACRGGADTAFCFGGDPVRLAEFAVFGRKPEGGRPEPVRKRKPNGFALYDMHGNVWEWCADNAESAGGGVVTTAYRDLATDPLCVNGSQRVYRGGSWISEATYCRSALRNCSEPGYATVHLGFRPVLAPRPSQ